MIFCTVDFFIFFAVVALVYFPLNRGPLLLRNSWLLVASYFFYASWNLNLLGLIIGSTAFNYAIGLVTERRRSKALLVVCVAVNLGLLGYFKYAGFFVDMAAALYPIPGAVRDFVATVVLPVGISFYTFQALGYVVDVYRGTLKAERNPINFGLYIAFFPQLVAGPIERAATLMPQITSRRVVGWERFNSGAWLFLWGVYKKVVVADNLAMLVNTVFASGAQPSGVEVVLASVAFTFQIYCDFSGYSDMARGCGRFLGFDLRLNFNAPFFAENPSDLWRRWHISLSSWLRDYLYIPLGGKYRAGRNMMITMLLGGLWHGAGWNFVAWGGFHGVALAVWARLRGRGNLPPAVTKPLGIIVTFLVLNVSFFLFRAVEPGQVWDYLGRVFTYPLRGGEDAMVWTYHFILFALPVMAYQFMEYLTDDETPVFRWPIPFRVVLYVAVLVMICVFKPEDLSAFIYFQF